VRLRYPGLPVVLTSGYNAVMAGEGPHGFELVLKPYTLDTLARVFGQALAGQAGRQSVTVPWTGIHFRASIRPQDWGSRLVSRPPWQ
jgi:hypothetical protein